jgi:TonB family protein
MHKMFFALALIPALALADSQLSTSNSAFTPPAATGNPHACGAEWYPPAALAAGEEGKTILAFHIDIDGRTKNISVGSSSGFADLDQAAIKCAAEWRYIPAAENGNAHEVDRKAAVEWSMTAPVERIVVTRGKTPPSPSELSAGQQPIGSQVCKNPMAPPAPLGKITVVFFQIGADGSIEKLKLFRSSGDEKLDELALTCASQWKYTPLPDNARRTANVAIVPIPW